jgi:transcriptional regulator with XRE-family HTH domain
MQFEDFRTRVLKMTLQEVADISNVSMSTVYELERGKRISKLSRGKILDGLSKHLGREVEREEIDEFTERKKQPVD